MLQFKNASATTSNMSTLSLHSAMKIELACKLLQWHQMHHIVLSKSKLIFLAAHATIFVSF